MFRRISGFAAALTLAVMLATATAFAATKTITIRVSGMKCGNCSSSVAKALKATAGVKEVEVSSAKGEALITYDDEKVTEAKLREVINGTGFKAEE
jgi:mercuric transport protein